MKDGFYHFTCLQRSGSNDDKSSLLFIIKLYESFFTQEEIREILLERNNGIFPFTYFIGTVINDDKVDIFFRYISNLFKDDQLGLRKLLSGHRDPHFRPFDGFNDPHIRHDQKRKFIQLRDLLKATYISEEQNNFELDFAKLHRI